MFNFVEMNKNVFVILSSLLLSLYSCNSALTNQKINKKREGLWIEKYSQDNANYRSIGKYKNDDPIKKWRYYLDEKIIKKEKYKDNNCFTRIYYENGKIQSKGTTTLDTTAKYAHWYYSDDWKFYNNKGKLILKRKYEKGNLISETKTK